MDEDDDVQILPDVSNNKGDAQTTSTTSRPKVHSIHQLEDSIPRPEQTFRARVLTTSSKGSVEDLHLREVEESTELTNFDGHHEMKSQFCSQSAQTWYKKGRYESSVVKDEWCPKDQSTSVTEFERKEEVSRSGKETDTYRMRDHNTITTRSDGKVEKKTVKTKTYVYKKED